MQDLPEPELDPEVKAAFDVAYDNIRQFHQAQKDKDTELSVETMPGVVCRRVSRPIGAHLLCSSRDQLGRPQCPAE